MACDHDSDHFHTSLNDYVAKLYRIVLIQYLEKLDSWAFFAYSFSMIGYPY